MSNAIDEITGVIDVGFGPVVKLEAICKHCNSVTTNKTLNFYSCPKCKGLATDVYFRSIRMFNTNIA